jgi:ASC-1-like (ASCH) protein
MIERRGAICNRGSETGTIEVNYHLVILKKPYLDLILSGRKTIELRLTRARYVPGPRTAAGDRLFLKASGGPVCAVATATEVRYYEDLTPERIAGIRREYNEQIGGGDAVWQSMMNCRAGFLVWLRGVRPIAPVRIDKKDWRAWVVLTPEKDFGLLNRRPDGEPPRAGPAVLGDELWT